MKLADSDAIILFFEFYKLIFLGTKFTEKVLQIRVTQPALTDKSKKVVVQMNNKSTNESHSSEEGKIVMIVDTSEAYSTDDMARAVNKVGSQNSDSRSN